MKINIEKMDHLGSGIGYIDQKVVFVPYTVTGDECEIEIVKENKNYLNGKLIKLIKPSGKRIDAFCPYFGMCGGCHIQNMIYEDTIKYKKERILNILHNYVSDVEFISNESPKFYRNKIELKMVDGVLGFYKPKSHDILKIEKCYITKECINNFLDEIYQINLKNGEVVIRCNYNDELLISIKTNDKLNILDNYAKYKVVGIIVNDKCVYGESFFLDNINNSFFKVSYDSFFQVNSYINSKLFDIITKYVDGQNVLDLYCGVGTLSIMASKKASKVFGIEVIPNAIKNALDNARINNVSNINFILGKVEDKIKYIKDDIDTIIIDPPRAGVDKKAMDVILNKKPKQIIYISCETNHLLNDLKNLTEFYNIKKVYALDMFSFTYHCETICVLERR